MGCPDTVSTYTLTCWPPCQAWQTGGEGRREAMYP